MLASYLVQQWAGRGNIFAAYASETALPAYSATAQGGPLLWNGSANLGVTAFLLAIGYGETVASTVAGAIGVTGASGQPSAPTSTSAITKAANLNIGGPSSACTVYSAGTVVNGGAFFLTTGQVDTQALTAGTTDENFIHLGGLIQVPSGCWAGVAASTALTTSVLQISLVWIEIPND